MSEEKDMAYAREGEFITRYQELRSKDEVSGEQYKVFLDELFISYQRLLDDTKLLTSLGDRLQRKLRSTNMLLKTQAEEIRQMNDDLQKKNIELKLTIDELTRARSSRKAQTYILILTFILFVGSEYLEDLFDSFFPDDIIYSFVFKTALLFSLRPLEGYLEKVFIRQAMQKEKRDLLSKVENSILSTKFPLGRFKI